MQSIGNFLLSALKSLFNHKINIEIDDKKYPLNLLMMLIFAFVLGIFVGIKYFSPFYHNISKDSLSVSKVAENRKNLPQLVEFNADKLSLESRELGQNIGLKEINVSCRVINCQIKINAITYFFSPNYLESWSGMSKSVVQFNTDSTVISSQSNIKIFINFDELPKSLASLHKYDPSNNDKIIGTLDFTATFEYLDSIPAIIDTKSFQSIVCLTNNHRK